MSSWNRRERRRAAACLMSRAFIEIRALAYHSREADDPSAALERIRWLADTCHNLPGVSVSRPPRRGEPDPFAGPWKYATPERREWLVSVLKSANLDTAWLDAAPDWPHVITPAERPRLARVRVRFPGSPREYAAVGTGALRLLMQDAMAHEVQPEVYTRHSPALAHLAPQGRHLIRAIRSGERPIGPAYEGATEYRCLLQMDDGAVVSSRLRLRTAAFDALPRALSLPRRLWLSASKPHYRQERDPSIWHLGHRHAAPDCQLCAPLPTRL